MTRKIIVTLALSILLVSCTKKFYANATELPRGVLLDFYDKDDSSRNKISVCVWVVEVVEDSSGRTAKRLKANSHCVVSSGFNLSAPPVGFDEGDELGLKVGMRYHVDINADEGVAHSNSWTHR